MMVNELSEPRLCLFLVAASIRYECPPKACPCKRRKDFVGFLALENKLKVGVSEPQVVESVPSNPGHEVVPGRLEDITILIVQASQKAEDDRGFLVFSCLEISNSQCVKLNRRQVGRRTVINRGQGPANEG